jgi:hypothetical protein
MYIIFTSIHEYIFSLISSFSYNSFKWIALYDFLVYYKCLTLATCIVTLGLKHFLKGVYNHHSIIINKWEVINLLELINPLRFVLG